MIAAFLCGLGLGALAYRAWWVKPRTLKAEPWDVLYGEQLIDFGRGDTIQIVGQTPCDAGATAEDPAHYGKGWGYDPYDAASACHYT